MARKEVKAGGAKAGKTASAASNETLYRLTDLAKKYGVNRNNMYFMVNKSNAPGKKVVNGLQRYTNETVKYLDEHYKQVNSLKFVSKDLRKKGYKDIIEIDRVLQISGSSVLWGITKLGIAGTEVYEKGRGYLRLFSPEEVKEIIKYRKKLNKYGYKSSHTRDELDKYRSDLLDKWNKWLKNNKDIKELTFKEIRDIVDIEYNRIRYWFDVLNIKNTQKRHNNIHKSVSVYTVSDLTRVIEAVSKVGSGSRHIG